MEIAHFDLKWEQRGVIIIRDRHDHIDRVSWCIGHNTFENIYNIHTKQMGGSHTESVCPTNAKYRKYSKLLNQQLDAFFRYIAVFFKD